jgi:hypothetical protein
MVACCGMRRVGSSVLWTPCPGAATVRCDEDQANVAVSFTAKTKSTNFGTEWSWEKKGDKLRFCGDCALLVVMANAQPLLKNATGKSEKMKTAEAINDLLLILGVHRKQTAAAQLKDARSKLWRASEQSSSKDTPAAADPLDELLPLARPLIPRDCFTHSLLVTICRVLLIHDGKLGYGRSAFDGHFEGVDVLRFQAMLYPWVPASVFDALRGLPTPRGKKWDVCSKNLIFFADARTLRRYMGTPYSMRDVGTISSEVVSVVVGMLKRAGKFALACTLDKVHGNSSCAVVMDGSGDKKRPFVCGAATQDDLSGAFLDYADLAGENGLDEKRLATGVLTILVHDLEGYFKNGLLAFVIPIGVETSGLIFAVMMRLRDEFFKAGCYLVHVGGDGAKSNLSAFEAIKAASTGTADTILADCKTPSEVRGASWVCGFISSPLVR